MRLLPILLTLLYSFTCLAENERNSYSFKKIDHSHGLSNSAVISIFQDNDGIMWIGTYDGINCYDGKDIETFRSDFSAKTTLSNNIIHAIQQADSNCIWISGNHIVNRFSLSSKEVVSNYEFPGFHSPHSNKNGNTWLIGTNSIRYYNTYHHRFIKIKKPDIKMGDPNSHAFVTDNGDLWLFPDRSTELYRFSLNSFGTDTLNTQLTITPSHFHSKPLEFISYQNGILCFVDIDKDLYIYDIAGKSKIYTRNISSLLEKYGSIQGIIPFYEDIIIGFKTNGLILLRASEKYEESILNRNICIFSIYKDPHQGIFWIGSDGQGAIMYAQDHSIATNIKLSDLSPNLTRQVRSLMTDKDGGLWCGTKGDGLIYIPDFQKGINATKTTIYSPHNIQNAISYSKWDKEFEVFTLQQSRYLNGFWLGTGDTGLYYYSYDDKKLHAILPPSGNPLVHIHKIYEENDSTLWLSSSEDGIHKVWLKEAQTLPCIQKEKKFHFFREQHEINSLFSMIAEGDSILWFASRNNGLIKMNKQTEKYQVISLKKTLHKSVDDILSTYVDKNGKMYLGTTAGLVSLTQKNGKLELHYVGLAEGLLNDMIHGILEDSNGFLWLSTNKGIIKYNPQNDSSHAYYYSSGVQIGEFSDDAYYQCPYTGKLIFGGTDGLIYMDKDVVTPSGYYPDIVLRKLKIGNKEVNISQYYATDIKALSIPGTKVSFALSFAVPDYLTGSEIEYSYMLEGKDTDWTNFSPNNEVVYSDITAGKYTLKIRYKKDVTNIYKTLTIPISIVSPWYQSIWAYLIYIVLIIAIGSTLFYLSNKCFQLKREMEVLSKGYKESTQCETSCQYIKQIHKTITSKLGISADHMKCTTNEQFNFIWKVTHIIEQNLNKEDLSSTFIADQMAMSPRQFYRRFKEISEISPSDLIKNYRIEKAAGLLVTTDISIQDIIADVGISSRAYFYKEFTRRFDMTPKDYREANKKK